MMIQRNVITQYACHHIYAKPLDSGHAYMKSALKAPPILSNKWTSCILSFSLHTGLTDSLGKIMDIEKKQNKHGTVNNFFNGGFVLALQTYIEHHTTKTREGKLIKLLQTPQWHYP